MLEVEKENPFLTSLPMQTNKDEEVIQALFKCAKDNKATEPKIRGGRFDSDAGKFVAPGILPLCSVPAISPRLILKMSGSR